MINRVRIFILCCLGFLFLCLGIAGYFLPGLPGTIFLILAAGCFLRSNQRMYKWVTEHRLFGRPVKRFLETGAMPARAKIISVSCIWLFSLVSMLAPYHLVWFKVPVIVLALVGTWYILSRPTAGKDDTDSDV